MAFLRTVKDGLISPKTVIKNTSPRFVLNGVDYGKLAIQALIGGALAGGAIFFESLAKVDFGTYNIFILPLLTTVWSGIQKWLRDNTIEN